MKKKLKKLVVCLCLAALAASPATQARAGLALGPLCQRSTLVLESGWREEILGPLYEHRQGEETTLTALRPLFSLSRNTGVDSAELDLLYPVFTYDRFGREYRVQLFQFLSLAGGAKQSGKQADRFTLFPFYFQQRGGDPGDHYTACLPFYGQLKNRLFREEIFFVTFPAYMETRRRGVVTENYLFPVFHLRHGPGLSGWQIWPLTGFESKQSTTVTNSFDEVTPVPGHQKQFVMWPLFTDAKTGLGSENPIHQQVLFPLYAWERSPQRDSTSYLWPLGLTVTDDRAQKYHEVSAPWPLIVFARGEGKTMTRVWPLFSEGHSAALTSRFYLWPIFRDKILQSPPLVRERTQVLFFLYSDVLERNTDAGTSAHRTDLWPLFVHKREHDGRERLQVGALLESVLPESKSLERNYSPLWTLWRTEKNPATKTESRSFLWNLYRQDRTADTRKTSFLLGLVQHEKTAVGQSWRLFYLPFGSSQKAPAPPVPAVGK